MKHEPQTTISHWGLFYVAPPKPAKKPRHEFILAIDLPKLYPHLKYEPRN